MERFAKVFEVNNRQLLVKKNVTNDDRPKLSLIMCFEGAEMDLGVIFPPTDEGDELLNAAFEEYDEVKAYKYTLPLKGCTTAFEAAAILLKGGKDAK